MPPVPERRREQRPAIGQHRRGGRPRSDRCWREGQGGAVERPGRARWRPRGPTAGWRSSSAALRLKVTTRTWAGSADPSPARRATRKVRTRVFPVPAPASTHRSGSVAVDRLVLGRGEAGDGGGVTGLGVTHGGLRYRSVAPSGAPRSWGGSRGGQGVVGRVTASRRPWGTPRRGCMGTGEQGLGRRHAAGGVRRVAGRRLTRAPIVRRRPTVRPGPGGRRSRRPGTARVGP